MDSTTEQLIIKALTRIEGKVDAWPGMCHDRQIECKSGLHKRIDDVHNEVDDVKTEVLGTKKQSVGISALVGAAITALGAVFK